MCLRINICYGKIIQYSEIIQKGELIVTTKKSSLHFTLLTFSIAFFASGILIVLKQYGYSINTTLNQTLQNPWINIPFGIYIMSPAIASYLILQKNHQVKSFKDWLRTVFYVKNNIFSYLFIVGSLTLYFLIHLTVSDSTQNMLPFYMIFLNLPNNLFIGGLEEAGWMFILQPELQKRYGFFLSSIFVGLIWFVWHLPLFFIPGTAHYSGLIDIGMFAVQLISFRFFYGAIYKITGKGYVFMSVLFHTLFNATSPVVGILPMTWIGSIIANAAIVLISIVSVMIYDKFKKTSVNKFD